MRNWTNFSWRQPLAIRWVGNSDAVPSEIFSGIIRIVYSPERTTLMVLYQISPHGMNYYGQWTCHLPAIFRRECIVRIMEKPCSTRWCISPAIHLRLNGWLPLIPLLIRGDISISLSIRPQQTVNIGSYKIVVWFLFVLTRKWRGVRPELVECKSLANWRLCLDGLPLSELPSWSVSRHLKFLWWKTDHCQCFTQNTFQPEKRRAT